jgi:hypothetical protein
MDHDRHDAIDIRHVLPHLLPEVQQREALDKTRIRAYAALYREGHTLGEVMVFQQGSDFYVADGFHRIAAAIQAGLDTIAATIRPGTLRDAILYACGCNLHGVPLTPADKRRRAMTMLADAEWQQWSDREIARHCGVSHVFVAKLRKALTGNVTSERTYRTKYGTQATMDTAAIGKHAVSDVSGDASSPRVSHPSAGTLHTAEGAAGASPTEAVVPGLQWREGDRPTSALADALCQVIESPETCPVPDSLIQAGLQEAEAVRAAFPTRLCQLLEPLQELTTIRDLTQRLLDIPPDWYARVDQCLALAFGALNELRALWQKHRHDAPEGLVQPRAPQRVRQPTKGQTRRKTKRTQTALILAAIHTAPQPLTYKDLRQSPGIDGSRLKRNMARLVAQGKIQEMPEGTFCGVR